ncbi:unnamed protein product [Miscanthus lutarioriparius]|uniref:Uncharacterized protein n=1 Tax=Miscanthus lutarioriparius TaxID=422564 RepID=A0A811R963_9POAL|nr:unnamed protein product [Miscanthus lutarioriparius]
MEAAVVTASHGAMGSLIAKLGDLLTAEYKLLKEAKGQILFLKAELESMHRFLKKISDTEQPDEQDKCWAKEVRELSYDIEDSISEFMLRVERNSSSKPRGFMGFINRSTKLLTTMNIRHDIAKEFEGLKVRVVQAQERRKRYQKTDGVTSKSVNTIIDIRLLAMYAEASGLVGMDGPRDELIQLMGGENELKVLSIVGFGGLGKLPLQMRFIASFRLLWTPTWNCGKESEFISVLRKFLLKQRYLIIIDDIWEAFAWDIIRCALPESINGIYPKDYTIEKNDLTRRWIAEGFICKVRGMDLEDIAKSYFNELINRSLIQPADTNCNGEVMSCKVHDMMLDLILHKSQEENFVTVIDDIQDMTGQQDKVHRLSLNLGGTVGDRVAGCVQLSQTRTLAIFGTSSYLPPFQLFKYLRVLGIEITVQSHPPLLLDFTEIHHLLQLRYLKIVAKGHEVVLPSKIGSMQQLETFEINATIKLSRAQSFRELPSDIVHLSRLSHLIIPYDIILPNGIDNMKSFRTLHYFNLRNSPNSIKGLGELTNLTNLKIICNFGEKANGEIVEKGREVLQTCLGKICSLKYLYMKIYCDNNLYIDALSSTPLLSVISRYSMDTSSQGFLDGSSNSITSMTCVFLLSKCLRKMLEFLHGCPQLSTWR